MTRSKPLTKLKKGALQRRLSIALAGAGSGARLLGTHAGSVFKSEEQRNAIRSEALAEESQAFARKLGELKGAYVKIGQLMAMYGDHFLPSEVSSALRELEDQTDPMDWSAIEPVIEQQLGSKADELKIEHTALAAASLSQVHLAQPNKDQQTLCLKIQYPGVAQTIESDFNTVLQMMRFARWIPNGKDFEAWLQDIKAMLVDEVDYAREARMTEHVASLVAGDERFIVPSLSHELCTDTILAMDFIESHSVVEARIARLSQSRRNALAQAMLENFFAELFEWGVMQTDPNFGNYRIQLRQNQQDIDKIVMLDFGAVRELSKDFQKALQKTIIAAHQKNHQAVIEGAIELGCLQSYQTKTVKQSFADFCVLLMEPFRTDHSDTPEFALNKKGEYSWHTSNLLKRVGKKGAKAVLIEGFSSPPKEFALIVRKLSGVFSFITELKAEFNAAPVIEKYLP